MWWYEISWKLKLRIKVNKIDIFVQKQIDGAFFDYCEMITNTYTDIQLYSIVLIELTQIWWLSWTSNIIPNSILTLGIVSEETVLLYLYYFLYESK